MNFKRMTAVLLTMAFLSGPASLALAEDVQQKQEELQRVNEQMQTQQNKLSQAQQQVDSVAGKLQNIQMELTGAQQDYNNIMSQLAATEKQIVTNTDLLNKAEKRLAERSQVLNKRMRDIYENGQVSYVDVLLGASDFLDFSTRMDLLKRVVNQDLTLVAQVRAERDLVAQKRAELERDRAAILEMKRVAAEKKVIIEARKKDQEQLLQSAVGERDVAERAYQELLDTSRQIERMIRNVQRGSKGSAGGSGALMWPIMGEITSPYGTRVHPIFGTSRYHSGIDIAADYGDAVAAADAGTIIFSGWMGGYGKAVIIDHGRGISTLYGHNSELLVGEGQTVRKGQTIAAAGSTGYSTGPHVHFEVRVNGEPTNPMSYLP
ncbi:MAG TPA: peptidoglycan DD-metalloendopeptidase family protein [Patescibacteria group bacterium]|nr:peptidoglycan DD-metalloendopeptidase family protein [Patescibacteria group bacterium]